MWPLPTLRRLKSRLQIYNLHGYLVAWYLLAAEVLDLCQGQRCYPNIDLIWECYIPECIGIPRTPIDMQIMLLLGCVCVAKSLTLNSATCTSILWMGTVMWTNSIVATVKQSGFSSSALHIVQKNGSSSLAIESTGVCSCTCKTAKRFYLMHTSWLHIRILTYVSKYIVLLWRI